ncbi:MAG TPA: maltose alpha-D-glucosyltransferase [Halothiobacillaceae bacterium]|nr:maltose alpha-D-glucosyltransferase [Halothiobacillaceae bacterium]
MTDTPAPWYIDAIIYEVHVKSFFDSTDDGIGDFRGLTEKLDYLQDLGVTAIWLLPFYPSPLRDDGYDIADYRRINPAYGSMRDFRDFVRRAHRRGLRVITELVVNHTSDQHAWFQRARRARPDSVWRDFYVWSDTDQKYPETRIIFLDTESSNWAWDPEAQAYYWHRFYSHQPDLNYDNPRVLKEMLKVMRHWLDMGVDGFRLDAIPYLVEREGTINENLPETHAVIRQIRAALDRDYSDKMLLGEANQWPEDVRPYFGDGDECHMNYHFPLMPRIYMAVAHEDRHPITDIMNQTPEPPEGCQWAIFLRNHDELTLEMVTDRERDYLWRYYASDNRARLNLGIRRRLAPLLENDRRKIELLNSLLMSMPGTPIIYYGDEIGMGDNIFLGDRDGVRTPMQWSPDRNGGFSRADPARLYLPPVMDPVYGFEAVNVEAQTRSPHSLLNWMKRLISVRKAHPAFSRGGLRFLYPGNRKVIAYLRELDGDTVLCVANLSNAPQPVELDLRDYSGRVPIELVGRSSFPPVGELPYFVTLPAYGFYWFLLAEEAEAPSWHEPFHPPAPELPTLVLPQVWKSLTGGEPSRLLQEKVLPDFLSQRRWFAAKGEAVTGISVRTLAELPADGGSALFLIVSVGGEEQRTLQEFALPLAIEWEEAADQSKPLPLGTLARVRRRAQMGALHDAVWNDGFVRGLAGAVAEDRRIETEDGGQFIFESTRAFPRDADLAALALQRPAREQSNSSVQFGDRMLLKLYRRLQAGVHPEVEIGRYLTEEAEFPNVPDVYGSLRYVDPAGTESALMVLMAFVPNQGDAWSFTLEYLKRFFETADVLPTDALGETGERHEAYLSRVRVLGHRTAELHRALARPTDDPAFSPEPVREADLAALCAVVDRWVDNAVSAIERSGSALAEQDLMDAQTVLSRKDELHARVRGMAPARVNATRTRCHGDLHLGQVLVIEDDFVFTDFEGEPARALAERRQKELPLRDVAGMLRSFDYCAAVALRERAATRPESRDMLESLAREWRDQAKAAFLEAYQERIDGSAAQVRDPDAARSLLDLFVLEKVLYEICYEAANRPDWIRIPLAGVVELMEAER